MFFRNDGRKEAQMRKSALLAALVVAIASVCGVTAATAGAATQAKTGHAIVMMVPSTPSPVRAWCNHAHQCTYPDCRKFFGTDDCKKLPPSDCTHANPCGGDCLKTHAPDDCIKVPPCDDNAECGPPPCKGEDCGPPPCDSSTCPPVTPPVTPTVTSGGGPNADAFCYGTGADSYLWVTPDVYNWLISAPGPGSSAAEHWSHGTMAFVVAGFDATGVMHNGYKPYCGHGTWTGTVVDNQGENITSGYTNAQSTWPASAEDPNGDHGIPEQYKVVIPTP
jgi:hypothetical protein